MVEALDFVPEVTVEQIGEKTFRLTCKGCDWMETAGAQNAATRKKNRHIADHKGALHGTPEVPTIMDALEGTDNVPEIKETPTPVRDLDYFRKLKEEAQAFIDKNQGKPEGPCSKDCLIQHEHIQSEAAQQTIEEFFSDETATKVPKDVGIDVELRDVALVSDPLPEMHTSVAVVLNPEDRGYELPRTRVTLTQERLRLQKGPSDRDRDAWMAARDQSVSATTVAKLGAAPDVDFAIKELIQEKVHGSSFKGNAYTEWGKEREPHLETVGYRLHGLVGESHLFFARTNHRHSASPDAIAIHPETGQVALGEYKTCGKELTLREAEKKGYLDQIQWQLYVMEATHCWLIWEWRRDDGMGGFEPEPGGRHLIMRDDARIEVLKTLADRFLDALDAYKAQPEQADNPGVQALGAVIHDLLMYREKVAELEEAARFMLEKEGLKSAEYPFAKVSYALGSARSSLDREGLERDHPGLLEKYTKPGKAPERPSLRITPRTPDE